MPSHCPRAPSSRGPRAPVPPPSRRLTASARGRAPQAREWPRGGAAAPLPGRPAGSGSAWPGPRKAEHQAGRPHQSGPGRTIRAGRIRPSRPAPPPARPRRCPARGHGPPPCPSAGTAPGSAGEQPLPAAGQPAAQRSSARRDGRTRTLSRTANAAGGWPGRCVRMGTRPGVLHSRAGQRRAEPSTAVRSLRMRRRCGPRAAVGRVAEAETGYTRKTAADRSTVRPALYLPISACVPNRHCHLATRLGWAKAAL
jgi:hypothetical protein